MKNIRIGQKVFLIVLSILLLLVIPFLFCVLFLSRFQTKEFHSFVEVGLESEIVFFQGDICYGNAFSCESVEAEIIGTYDTSNVGVYSVKYIYSFREKKLEKEQTIKVIDNIPPKLEIEDQEYTYCKNGTIPKYSVKATDNFDGDLSSKVTSFLEDGKIVFSVTDSSSNVSVLKIDAVEKDKDAPVLSLNGEKKIYLSLHDSYIEPGATAYDICDGDLTKKIEIEGKVNVNRSGTYVLNYKAKDQSGNFTSLTRTVVVENTNDTRGSSNTIYLTFDDGPSIYTSKLLDILKKYDAKATFFVTNQKITNGYDDVILRAYQEGHTIGLHSYSHDYSIYQNEETYFQDLYMIQEKVKNITGYTSKIIRFPGGSSNTISKNYDNGAKIMSKLTKAVEEKGFRYYDWNILSGDAGQTQNTSEIVSNVIREFGKFDTPVVLQHDIKGYSVDAVENILQYGINHGYRFEAITMDTPLIQHRINN